MEINTTYLVLTIIGTGLTFFWLILYFKGRNKYDAYINALRSDEYFMKDFYFIGYEMMNLFKVEFRDKYSNSREKKMSEVKGKKYAQFYIMANLAAELTYLLTFSVIGFLLAAISKEPLLSGMGIALSLLMIYYTENILSQKVSKRQ